MAIRVLDMTKRPAEDDLAALENLLSLMRKFGTRLGRVRRRRSELTLIQWTTLRFMARVNPVSRTVTALSLAHGIAKGTASSRLKRLMAEGFLKQVKLAADKRVVQFDLTRTGKRTAWASAPQDLLQVFAGVPAGALRKAVKSLERVVAAASPANRHRIGRCRDCVFLLPEKPLTCGLVGLRIRAADRELECLRFQPT